MSQESPNPKANQAREVLAGMIGGGLGAAAALGLGKLIRIESFWLELVLMSGCVGIVGFLAQKIARKYR